MVSATVIREETASSASQVVAWISGSALVSINEVTLRRVQLVPEWVTICNQPLRPAQPFTLSGTENEYWRKCGDALRLGG